MRRTAILMTALIALPLGVLPPGATPAYARPANGAPFDEQTLDRIQVLNRAITDHYEQLETTATELEARRGLAMSSVEDASNQLVELEKERSEIMRLPEPGREHALRVLEEHRIDTKSRYLEALAEKHAIDLEAISSFEDHATAILQNLEKLGDALDASGEVPEESAKAAREAFNTVQRGTAIALNTLEEWGTLTRDDPRFRALWATSRVLNRNALRLSAPESIRMTVDLVRDRSFVVRSLIDQARAMRAALDQQGLLLQVAAQNQMLRLHFVRLGAINGMELPDLEIEESIRRILEDIEEEPFVTASGSSDPLRGFDDCLDYDQCE
jgi:hypothetical protein